MKAILCSIILISGVMFMMMSTTTLIGIRKAKNHKYQKPEEKERLINLPGRLMIESSLS
jgi:hypothetical protein